LSGATNCSLALTNVQLANGGRYSVKVTNQFGAVTSFFALLIVQAPPMILVQPTNLTVNVGGAAAFYLGATGSPTLSYQWSINTTNIPNATNPVLTIANVQLANAGVYAAAVTNSFGSAASSNATLTVIDVLDHFSWSPIPSPRFVNAPFGVAVQARDSVNQVFTNFAGTISLTSASGVTINPAVSTSFAQGIWTGAVTIPQTVSNLVLEANDGAGHVGLANAINVVGTPTLQMLRSGGSLVLFWPMDPAGFSLESSTSLWPPQWTQVAAPPWPVGDQNLELFQITNTVQLYRLRFTLP
jgi:hypothetical protein